MKPLTAEEILLAHLSILVKKNPSIYEPLIKIVKSDEFKTGVSAMNFFARQAVRYARSHPHLSESDTLTDLGMSRAHQYKLGHGQDEH